MKIDTLFRLEVSVVKTHNGSGGGDSLMTSE